MKVRVMLTHRLRSQWKQFECEYEDLIDAKQALYYAEFTCQYCGRVNKALTGIRNTGGTVDSSTGQPGPDITAAKNHERIGKTQACTQCWSNWYLDKISCIRPYGIKPHKLADGVSTKNIEVTWYRPIKMHTCWNNGRIVAVCDYYRHWFIDVKTVSLKTKSTTIGNLCWSDRMHRRWRTSVLYNDLNSEITTWYLTVA